jgi:membrane-bound lytic murein transglycosylase D
MNYHNNFSSHRSSHNPSFIRWIKIGAVLLFIGILITTIFSCTEKILLDKTGLLAVEWPTKLDFCGEEVPLDDFYVREDWEREFLILLNQDYQNILYLKRSPKYFSVIEAELDSRGLPEDLKYIAVAESALRESITSSAGADGIWQFIPSTAQNYGLKVDDKVDERKHFEKATSAAVDYLDFLHNKFGNWTLSAAAYNAGENGIERRLGEQDVESYYDLYLNSETARYLFRILAIKEIMEHPEKYGYELSDSDYFAWPDFEVITVNQIGDLASWARERGTTLRAIKELNPWIIGGSLPDGVWRVKVPSS